MSKPDFEARALKLTTFSCRRCANGRQFVHMRDGVIVNEWEPCSLCGGTHKDPEVVALMVAELASWYVAGLRRGAELADVREGCADCSSTINREADEIEEEK